jgi:phosphoribosylformylglycinamidine synthase
MFKNETHNHPTEIEPFGGAATCLGGAIRDPLSGRSYVYHAMRVTGSGDPRKSLTETIPGKLPQRKITTEAAHGYSSYGNQIGLATGGVFEIYDEGYIAKRMEIGAVIAAAPEKNVVRGKPVPGDRIILVGGRTGRDGCGGATGSSKAHTEDSITTCGAEVQKGNPPTERKIQRLFRDPAVSRMIKKCNDFGAGGVSVAIGELADGLHIDLSAVPKKYEGLDGTELAISESQERMAVLVDAADAGEFIARADKENLEATCVATVTADRRVTMTLNGKAIVSISRDFINTNGVLQSTALSVQAPDPARNFFTRIPPGNIAGETLKTAFIETLQDLNVCSQRGLVERFDSSIGAGSVLMPFGGKNQITPTESMVAKLPVTDRDTYTGTVMSYGFNPSLASWSPFHGALYAVVEAAAKVVAAGGDHTRIRLTLQEYFEKLGTDPKRWGKPFSALLGAFLAQKGFGIPAIGGKDSMSGTFESISVPPTLVAFAVSVMDVRTALSPEFKTSGSTVVVVPCVRDAQELPDFTLLNEQYCRITRLIGEGKITAAHTVRTGGVAVAVFKMALGNSIGMRFGGIVDRAALFRPDLGSIVCEVPAPFNPGELFTGLPHSVLGTTISGPVLQINDISISLDEARAAWESPLEPIFHTSVAVPDKGKPAAVFFRCSRKIHPPYRVARPRVFIPVFPGTNCEYDSGRAFTRAGGVVDTCVIRNRSPQDIADTLAAMKTGIDAAQIIMIPGGFSAGDEPDGSGKFIAAVFRNPVLRDAVMKFLTERGGLMLGICNGFQALIKLGLVPFGEIRDMDERCPTLTFNTIGRHASQMVRTRICSTLSPWFSKVRPGEVYTLPISHGEGRFIARPETIAQLTEHGQIATQYVDESGDPTYSIRDNPNGSLCAIEGITSPDDRILGKMAHSERVGPNVAKNIAGQKDQKIFEAGIGYFQ